MKTTILATIHPDRPARPSLVRRFVLMLALWNERRALAILDRRALADLGLSPDDVARETRRPPWDMPAARRY